MRNINILYDTVSAYHSAEIQGEIVAAEEAKKKIEKILHCLDCNHFVKTRLDYSRPENNKELDKLIIFGEYQHFVEMRNKQFKMRGTTEYKAIISPCLQKPGFDIRAIITNGKDDKTFFDYCRDDKNIITIHLQKYFSRFTGKEQRKDTVLDELCSLFLESMECSASRDAAGMRDCDDEIERILKDIENTAPVSSMVAHFSPQGELEIIGLARTQYEWEFSAIVSPSFRDGFDIVVKSVGTAPSMRKEVREALESCFRKPYGMPGDTLSPAMSM